MRYTRIYTDEAGGSRFEDVTIAGEERTSPVSAGRSEYSEPIQARSVVLRRVVTPHPEAPHRSPRRQFAVHLRGSAEVEVSSGEVRTFGPGDVVLLEDIDGAGHVTREIGDTERVTMFIELADRPE
jgi:hypothetical protein